MKTLKKLLIIVLVVLSISCFAVACGDKNKKENNSSQSNTLSSTHVSSCTSVSDKEEDKPELFIVEGTKLIGLTDYGKTQKTIVVPSIIERIGDYAFYENSILVKVELSDNVEIIGQGAFYGCDNLTSITIGKSVKSIGINAFEFCYKLIEVYNKSNLAIETDDYNVDYSCIDKYALNVYTPTIGKSKLTTDNNGFITYNDGKDTLLVNYMGEKNNITIPSNVTKIRDYALAACINIVTVEMGKNVTSIGNRAFLFCRNLSGVTIGENITSIGDSSFRGCINLTSITISNNVISVGWLAFAECSKLESVIIGNSVTSIGYNAFIDCPALKYNVKNDFNYLGNTTNPYFYLAGISSNLITTANVDSNCKIIGGSVFRGCSNLNSIIIPNGVISLGYNVFAECKNMTSITISDNVKSIGDYAFYGCTSLTSVNYLGTIDQWVQIEFESAEANPLKYAKKLYINGDLITNANITTATKINSYAFYNCDSLTNVTIGECVTSIGYKAFCGCASIASVSFINPNEWYYTSSSTATSGTSISSTDLTNTSTTATYLRDTYDNYYWKRNV